ncbi:glycosyltransferase family 2 protein [Cohnella yongneupensis]|uniref:Glycosyltransferase family 2 protein n=1 Tax=Cohnella yongneupensis TaxID=425006 RepID=A0ABW0R5B2_9BACL
MESGVSIVIPTFNGGSIFEHSVGMLLKQDFARPIEIVVIDSGSTDNTVEIAKSAGAIVHTISNKDFHHSRTRNQAVAMTSYENVVLLVQDAIPVDEKWLGRLVSALEDNDVVAAYGQQIPHHDADLYARFEVDYHSKYLGDAPIVQEIGSIKEFEMLPFDEGLRRIRFDNVCAIYKKKVLLETPFPDVPFGEDMAWAFEVIKQGHVIMYDPRVKVHHSHNRSPNYRFRRAIIDNVVCAEVMGKLKRDMTFLKYNDLLMITEKTNQMASKIHEELGHKSAGQGYSLKLLKKSKSIKAIYWFIMKLAKRAELNSAVNSGIVLAFQNHINYVLQLIKEQYSNATNEQLNDTVDQIVGSMVGGLYGETYASYKQKGVVPHDIALLIEENSKGV